ncbi:hypothetical protein [Kribbella italica]|uniref:NAD(P)-dependent dehydrogenase (Short-subunit alcohol dehydrogenase family) n=1 Tax=Kribbella italica TaxID=1540520 RepID=A0A7W9JHJ1_9ACTN|nr:hypothetical protein [Kribbella italica]MBB5841603.1 NAD(P)-dependent dehydrogenase (short-subunit alcohol dehydrogenase family) [Kribbella italica]
MIFGLTERLALVTGSSRGIGLAIARGYLSAEARVPRDDWVVAGWH